MSIKYHDLNVGVTRSGGGGGGASEAQLAYVETGTTASRNYTAGQYIALNGLLYTADTSIATGATFYTSGGNKNLTECVGGGFNNIIKAVTKSVTVESGSNHLVPLGIYKPYIPVAYDFAGYMFHTVNTWENQWYALCTDFNLNKYNSGTFTGTIYYI